MKLSPSVIRYSHDSISNKFTDGTPLFESFRDLLSGKLSVHNIPLITCFWSNGAWFAVSGNRRLFLYKKLQEAGVLSTIEVRTTNKIHKEFTTKCNGMTIRCRGKPNLEQKIQQIISSKRIHQNAASGATSFTATRVNPSLEYHDEDDEDDDGSGYNDYDDDDEDGRRDHSDYHDSEGDVEDYDECRYNDDYYNRSQYGEHYRHYDDDDNNNNDDNYYNNDDYSSDDDDQKGDNDDRNGCLIA